MKLLSIRIHNINSLKGEHFIDFNEGALAETGLYAIIGSTGSGKSTILDCITLSLYGETPRQSNINKNTILNYGAIINKNSDYALAEIEYKVNDKQYLSKWSIKKNRNNRFNEYTMELSEKVAGNYIPLVEKKSEVPKMNEEIIGLNYDQFLKSILLSQGDFASFLQAKADDRSKILEKITGTQIYRTIGRKSFEKQKEAKFNLDRKKEELGYVNLLEEEEIEKLKEQIIIFEKEDKVLNEQINSIDKKIKIKTDFKHVNNKIEETKSKIIVVLKEKESFKEDEIKLDLHKKILPLKSEIDAYFTKKENLEANKILSKKYIDISEEIAEVLGKDKLILKQLQKEQSELNDEAIRLKPILKQVRVLDKEIFANKEKNKLTKEQLNKLNIEKQESNVNLKLAKEMLEGIKKELSKKRIWQEQNSVLNNIEAKIQKIKTKQEYYNKELLSLNKIEQQGKEIDGKKVVDASFSKLNLDAKLEQSRALLHKITSRKEEITKQITTSKTDEELEQIIAKNELLQKEYDSLFDLAEENNELVFLIKNLKKDLKILAQTQKNETEIHNKTKHEVEIIGLKINELTAKQKRQLLESKYEDDRLNLKEKEECPLCGSTEHPFVQNYVNTLSQTEKDLQEINLHKEKLDADLNKSEKLIIETKEKINLTEKQIVENGKKQDLLLNEFKTISKENKFSVNELKQIQSEKESLEQERIKNKSQLKNIQDLAKANVYFDVWESVLSSVETLNETKNEIDVLLKPYSLYLKNIENLDEQILVLENQYNKLDIVKNELIDLESKLEVGLNNQKNIETLASKINSELEKYENQNKSELLEIDLLLKKRFDLLPQDSVDDFESDFNKKINTNKDSISKINNEITEKETSLKSYIKQIEAIKLEIEKDETKIEQVKKKLNAELQKFGFTNIESSKSAILHEDELRRIEETERVLLKKETELSANIKTFEAEKQALEKQDDNSILLEDLFINKKNTTQKRDEYLEQIGENKSQLHADEQNKKQYAEIAEVLSALEKEYKKWASLAEIIGDSEGKKFTKFAQDLTLMHLLKFANDNLKKLTKRYVIIHEKHDSVDELFVVDTFMANEKRSVRTLSGGETFLVSLSLALGLSELAGKNTKIESLFIDEGFGSLDEDTLEVAIHTLDNLQYTSNITIGIISHVKALKERINTKIVLTRNNLGISSIEVVG